MNLRATCGFVLESVGRGLLCKSVIITYGQTSAVKIILTSTNHICLLKMLHLVIDHNRWLWLGGNELCQTVSLEIHRPHMRADSQTVCIFHFSFKLLIFSPNPSMLTKMAHLLGRFSRNARKRFISMTQQGNSLTARCWLFWTNLTTLYKKRQKEKVDQHHHAFLCRLRPQYLRWPYPA